MIATHLVVKEVGESHSVLLPSFRDVGIATNSELLAFEDKIPFSLTIKQDR